MGEYYMIIYKVTNEENGKVYIGQTIRSLSKRQDDHYRSSNSCHFHHALKLYDRDCFVWEIIEECSSVQEMNDREKYFIQYFDSFNNGYNKTLGGEGRRGPYPESGKQKQREINLGKTHTEETKRKISEKLKGRKFSEEHRRKLSENHNGGVEFHTEETKRKISERQMGEKNQFFGKTHTEETKQLIREKMIGDNSPRAKSYIITTPLGEELRIKGLRAFCREHGLTHNTMSAVAKGKQKHHKGYKCKYAES